MKRDYFISFEFYDRKFINKFIYGIQNIDIKEISIKEVAKNMIKEENPDIDLSTLTIKITSFNNIEA